MINKKMLDILSLVNDQLQHIRIVGSLQIIETFLLL
jgi:hypothetical protein